MISTGLSSLDHALDGGFLEGELIVISGRPGIGKSSLSLSIALHVLRSDSDVLCLNLESPPHELSFHLIAAAANVDMVKLRSNRLAADDFGRLRDSDGESVAERLFVLTRGQLDCDSAIEKIQEATLERRFRFVVVDCLQRIVRPVEDEDDRRAEILEFARRLRVLAREQQCAVALLSQLEHHTPHTDEYGPRLVDLPGEGALEEIADVVLLLHQNVYDDAPWVDLVVARNRRGSPATVRVEFRKRYGKFVDFVDTQVLAT